jgi:hypothetical protein
VTPARRRLLTLAVALAPDRALALLGRLGDPDVQEVLAEAALLAAATRRARLGALAATLAGPSGPGLLLAKGRAVRLRRPAPAGTAPRPMVSPADVPLGPGRRDPP